MILTPVAECLLVDFSTFLNDLGMFISGIEYQTLRDNRYICSSYLLSFVPSRIFFHSYGDVNIIGEKLHMLTYTRHSWPLNSECSIVCPINCYTENLSW